jgi:hypothetical protein
LSWNTCGAADYNLGQATECDLDLVFFAQVVVMEQVL